MSPSPPPPDLFLKRGRDDNNLRPHSKGSPLQAPPLTSPYQTHSRSLRLTVRVRRSRGGSEAFDSRRRRRRNRGGDVSWCFRRADRFGADLCTGRSRSGGADMMGFRGRAAAGAGGVGVGAVRCGRGVFGVSLPPFLRRFRSWSCRWGKGGRLAIDTWSERHSTRDNKRKTLTMGVLQ